MHVLLPVLPVSPSISSAIDANWYLAWLPILFGGICVFSFSGDWFQRIVWCASVPVVPVVIALAVYLPGTDAEGVPYVMLVALGPLFFLIIGVAIGSGVLIAIAPKSSNDRST